MNSNTNGNFNSEEMIISEHFFIILIIKEFLYNNLYENYYENFLDINGLFNEILFSQKVNEIYYLISNYDATCLRPNNLNNISEDTIRNIVLSYGNNYKGLKNFSDDIITHLEYKTIEIDKNNGLSEDKVIIAKNGIDLFLKKYYINNFYNGDYHLITTLENFVNRVINILKNKRY